MGPEDQEIKEPLISNEQNHPRAQQEHAAGEGSGGCMSVIWSKCGSFEKTLWTYLYQKIGVTGPGDVEAPPEDPESKGDGIGVSVLMTTCIMLGETSWRALGIAHVFAAV